MISKVKSIIFININLGLEGHAKPKLFGGGRGQTEVP
jgi:hypothetical protein